MQEWWSCWSRVQFAGTKDIRDGRESVGGLYGGNVLDVIGVGSEVVARDLPDWWRRIITASECVVERC
jgi:hypothetical protein